LELCDKCGGGNRRGDIRIIKHTAMSGGLGAKCKAIAELAAEIWREHYTPIIGAGQVEYMLSNIQSAERIYADIMENEYTYFTAEIPGSGEMAGYSAVQPRDGYLLLSKLYVRKEWRGMGVARRFLEEVVEIGSKAYNFNAIRLTVNKHNETALAAYKKMGFETIDAVEADIGGGYIMDDYILELKIGV